MSQREAPEALELNDVLELSGLTPERQRARLRTDENPDGLRPDGTFWEVRGPEELTLRQTRDVMAKIMEMQVLARSSSTDEDDARLRVIVNETAAELLVDAPAELIERLGDADKTGLAMGFFVRCGGIVNAAAGQAAIGLLGLANLSPGFNGSTEATP